METPSRPFSSPPNRELLLSGTHSNFYLAPLSFSLFVSPPSSRYSLLFEVSSRDHWPCRVIHRTGIRLARFSRFSPIRRAHALSTHTLHRSVLFSLALLLSLSPIFVAAAWFCVFHSAKASGAEHCNWQGRQMWRGRNWPWHVRSWTARPSRQREDGSDREPSMSVPAPSYSHNRLLQPPTSHQLVSSEVSPFTRPRPRVQKPSFDPPCEINRRRIGHIRKIRTRNYSVRIKDISSILRHATSFHRNYMIYSQQYVDQLGEVSTFYLRDTLNCGGVM